MTIVEDMRQTDPLEYIRAVDLQPEDSLGFCLDFDNSAIYFAWADR